jgi:hypothetical protein
MFADEGQQRRQAIAARRRQVLGQADRGDVVRIGGQDLPGTAAGIDAQARNTRPDTMAESLAAANSSFEASPDGTIQTIDWQPSRRCSSVFHASGKGGSLRPRSIRYW